jgi:hypothetical protein
MTAAASMRAIVAIAIEQLAGEPHDTVAGRKATR